jgi:ribosome-associated protein
MPDLTPIVSPMAKRQRQDQGESHQTFPSTSTSDPVALRAAAIEVARLLDDDKCDDVLILDVQGLSQVSDYLVIASGTSDRQMRGAADDTAKLAGSLGWPVFRQNADDRTTWVVLDCVDLVVHIFEPNSRAHYDLEMLWGDAPRVAWDRPGRAKSRDLAGLGSDGDRGRRGGG